jgi:predicted N-acetyltransferase YhbS
MSSRVDGLTLRTATARDLPQICTLLAERGDEADAEDLLLVVGDPEEGLDAVMVVVDGDRVVSTATLLRETVAISGIDVPTGQIEMVATDASYEGRGLVRTLMEEAHRRSTDRGDLLQVMVGIPYFYRQFGYSYAMPIPLPWDVSTAPPVDPTLTVRVAGTHDIGKMAALQDAAQASADVRMPHAAGCWRWLVRRSGSSQLVAEQDGSIIATARQTPPDEGVVLGELAGSAAGLRAIVATAVAHGEVALLERAHARRRGPAPRHCRGPGHSRTSPRMVLREDPGVRAAARPSPTRAARSIPVSGDRRAPRGPAVVVAQPCPVLDR